MSRIYVRGAYVDCNEEDLTRWDQAAADLSRKVGRQVSREEAAEAEEAAKSAPKSRKKQEEEA